MWYSQLQKVPPLPYSSLPAQKPNQHGALPLPAAKLGLVMVSITFFFSQQANRTYGLMYISCSLVNKPQNKKQLEDRTSQPFATEQIHIA